MLRALLLVVALFPAPFAAAQDGPRIGVVLMHGKGGLPDGAIHQLAIHLAEKHLVANLEMPWSSRRDYDVEVAAGVAQVEAALADLRAKGAAKVVIAGHSLGGDAAHPALQERVAESRSRAAALVAEGKGTERTRFVDWSMRGNSPVITAPAAYLTWFDPNGAMNELASIRRLDPGMPVLFIVPTNDNPALLRAKPRMAAALPRNASTRVYEPVANHIGAPTASREEIARWIVEVAGR